MRVSSLRGVFLIGVTGLYFSALGMTDPALAASLFHTYPILVFLVGSAIHRGSFAPLPLALCLVSMVGVLMILGPSAKAGEIGAILALCSAALMAVRINLERALENDLNPLHVLVVSSLVAALLLLPFIDLSQLAWDEETLLLIVLLTIMASFSQLIALQLMALGEWKSVTVYAYAEIPFVLILSQLMFGTSITLLQAIGMVVILVAGIAFVRVR